MAMSQILETTIDLMHIRSTPDNPGEIGHAIAYAHDFLSASTGLKIHRYEHNGKPALVASTVDTLSPDILMIGHLDVAPAGPALFEPRLEGGRLLGRGACDMKSEDAVMLHVMRLIAQEPNPPSIALMLTTDEETGGMDGVRHLVEDVGYRCKVALVPDGGEQPEEVMLASKGVVHVRLTARGVKAHGSAPWKGENAIEKLLEACGRICQAFPSTDKSDHWEPTCNIGTMKGGQVTNQVPDVAVCTLDIRYPGPYDEKEMIARVAQAAPGCELEVLVATKPSVTSIDDPYLKRYEEIFKRLQGADVKRCNNHSGHDGRFLSAYGIPVIVSRPLSGDQHAETEWVDLKSLEDFFELYSAFVRSFSR